MTAPDSQHPAVWLEEERCFVPRDLLKHGAFAPDQAIVAFEHQGFDLTAFSLGTDGKADLAPATQVGLAAKRPRAPDVVSEGPFKEDGAVPLDSILGPGRVAQMQVQVPILGRQCGWAAVPGSRVDKELVLEDQKMRIAGVPVRDAEPVNLLPLPPVVVAGQDQNGGRRMHRVSVRTTSKGQKQPAFESDQIGERVVLTVMEHASHECHPNLRQGLVAPGLPGLGAGRAGAETAAENRHRHGVEDGLNRG